MRKAVRSVTDWLENTAVPISPAEETAAFSAEEREAIKKVCLRLFLTQAMRLALEKNCRKAKARQADFLPYLEEASSAACGGKNEGKPYYERLMEQLKAE
jgi:hypothetical protein